jgi:hypothetical protein
MGVTVEEWEAWEAGATLPPLGKMEEISHRWDVSLDFLYRGLIDWVGSDIRPGLQDLKQPDVPVTVAGSRANNTGKGTAPRSMGQRRRAAAKSAAKAAS